MTVLVLAACPAGLRGDLSKWMMEVSTGVYIGRLTARVREALWDRVRGAVGAGRATMVYSARNEQGFAFRVHQTAWQPLDFDGLTLMCRPLPQAADDKQRRAAHQPDRPTEPPDLSRKMEVPLTNDLKVPSERQEFAPAPKRQEQARRGGDLKGGCHPAQPVDARGDEARENGTHQDRTDELQGGDVREGAAQLQAQPLGAQGGSVPVKARKVTATGHDPHDGGTSHPLHAQDRPGENQREGGSRSRSQQPSRPRDALPYPVYPADTAYPAEAVAIDMETTGLKVWSGAIIEMAAVRVRDGRPTERFEALVRCDRPLPPAITALTGLNDAALAARGIPLKEAVERLLNFIGPSVIVCHYAKFDLRFLAAACQKLNLPMPTGAVIDTVDLAHRKLENLPNAKLITLAQRFGLADQQAHRALPDSLLTAQVYLKLIETE